MRIAYLVNHYPKASHTFIRREIAALEHLGTEIERFTIRPAGEDLVDADDRAEQARTTVLLEQRRQFVLAPLRATLRSPGRMARALQLTTRLGRRSERGVLRHLAYLAEAAQLTETLRSRQVSHVHAHFGTNPAAVAMLWSTLSGGTYSFTVHGPEEFDHPEQLSIGDKIEQASFVVAVSNFGRSQLYRWCGHDHWTKIHIVGCTVDQSFLDGLTPVPDRPRFVCIGRLCEQKGQMLLLEAAIELAKTHDFELDFIGDGEFRRPMQDLIDSHALGHQIRLCGWRSGPDVRQALIDARAMVLPSFAEGLPVGIMEALALGRPVISTYVAGIPELVVPGQSGWLVPAGSVGDLVDAMAAALDTPVERLTEMGANGHRAVLADHHDRTEATRLAEYFRGVVPGD